MEKTHPVLYRLLTGKASQRWKRSPDFAMWNSLKKTITDCKKYCPFKIKNNNVSIHGYVSRKNGRITIIIDIFYRYENGILMPSTEIGLKISPDFMYFFGVISDSVESLIGQGIREFEIRPNVVINVFLKKWLLKMGFVEKDVAGYSVVLDLTK